MAASWLDSAFAKRGDSQQLSAVCKCASAEETLDVIFAGEHIAVQMCTVPTSWANSMPISIDLLNRSAVIKGGRLVGKRI